jgi:competence protein ComEA
MKPGWAAWLIGFSILLSLLAAGVIYLLSGRPRGEPIRLEPLPTPVPLVVQVSGAVSQPGLYQPPAGSRIQDAIRSAGGQLPNTNLELINQAAQLQDGQLVWVPFIEAASETAPPGLQNPSSGQAEQAPALSPSFPINLNSATLEELQELPGIGEVRAQSIITYRTAHGPFQSIEDIQAVEGIGPGIFEKIKDLIIIDSIPPGSVPP